MNWEIKSEQKFKYIEEGEGEVLLLLHGLFGALSNWDEFINKFKDDYKVIIPLLPIYDMPLKKAGIPGLVQFVSDFIDIKQLTDMTLIGNSLGGHIGLVYTLQNEDMVKRLILTGSSGLFENTMGASFPKRGNFDFVKEKVEYTFYDPKIATPKLVDEVFAVTKSIPSCLRMVSIARSAQKHNISDELYKIKKPTLLVWGLNDTITPPVVAHDFNRLIAGSELRFIDKCCHAPMMERPIEFNNFVENFLKQ
jgi:pimeloyl-ACP methyl ester carboxylesterase